MHVAPLVSVLLPVWNGERFLRASIDSTTSQTFRAFELIVVDDGSTDGSVAVAREAAALDPRIVVLSLPHDGLPAALNAGIAAARGTYLARMAADDLAAPTRLERQVAFLDGHPRCVVVGSAVDVVDAQEEHLGIVRFARTAGLSSVNDSPTSPGARSVTKTRSMRSQSARVAVGWSGARKTSAWRR